jgi:Gas vesicle synthesis protein GvpL/GvpF
VTRQQDEERRLCVYALCAAPVRLGRSSGIAGEPLRAVTVGAAAAIVGESRGLPRPTTANLRKYDRVIQELARRTPALLPARFATCVSEDELVFILRARQQSFRRNLEAVRNRAQMTIRIVGGSRGSEEAKGSKGRSSKGAVGSRGSKGSGRSYLNARAAELARAREIAGFHAVRTAVRRWVKDERVERQAAVASVYHLVPRDLIPAYRRALQGAAAASGVRLVISGPWPPYAFADSW